MNIAQQKLHHKITELKKVFDFKDVLTAKTDIAAIARYYKVNKIAYSLFHSRDDFVHMGISRDGKYKSEDLLEQAKIIEIFIRKVTAKNVLELATGRGATSFYLAQKFPAIHFEGLDLPDGQLNYAIQKSKKVENFTVNEGDYYNLKKYPERSFDIVFVIEALCHSNDKGKVLEEVQRVLREGGLFIIIDGFSGKPQSHFTTDEMLAKELIEKWMKVASFENYGDFLSMLKKNSFKLLFEEDASFFIVPTLKRFERQAKFLLSLPKIIGKTINKVFPPEFTNNAISGYLMPIAIELKIAKYMVVVAQKK